MYTLDHESHPPKIDTPRAPDDRVVVIVIVVIVVLVIANVCRRATAREQNVKNKSIEEKVLLYLFGSLLNHF